MITQGQIPGERVRETVEEVLSHPPFPQDPGPIKKVVDGFLTWLGELFRGIGFDLPESSVGLAVEVLWVLIIAAIVLYLAYLLVILVRTKRLGRRSPKDREFGRDDLISARVTALREEARHAELAGDYTLALRLYFFALVIGLGQQGELEYKEAWTNRELLARGAPGADVAQLLRPLVGELDAHSFGLRKTEPREVRHFAELCERLLVVQSA